MSDRRAEPWFGPEESKLWAVAPDLAAPTEGAELELVVDSKGGIGSWAEAADGAIALIATRFEGPRSYEQPGLYLARGEWPRRDLERLAPGYDFPFGEAISSDQHPPRGGGECPLAIAADGSVVTRVGKHGSSLLVKVEGDRVTEWTGPGQEVIAGTASADGSSWALTLGDARTPGDLARFDARTQKVETLHRGNPWLDEIALGQVEEFWYPSFDGTRIQAWLMKPATSGADAKLPAVLEIHGGPHTAYGHGFFHEFHVLAGAGYAVLYTNPRGSTTYGQAFANVIQYRFPDEDAKDLFRQIREAVVRAAGRAKIEISGGVTTGARPTGPDHS